jgi:hypothetical protein
MRKGRNPLVLLGTTIWVQFELRQRFEADIFNALPLPQSVRRTSPPCARRPCLSEKIVVEGRRNIRRLWENSSAAI